MQRIKQSSGKVEGYNYRAGYHVSPHDSRGLVMEDETRDFVAVQTTEMTGFGVERNWDSKMTKF